MEQPEQQHGYLPPDIEALLEKYAKPGYDALVRVTVRDGDVVLAQREIDMLDAQPAQTE